MLYMGSCVEFVGSRRVTSGINSTLFTLNQTLTQGRVRGRCHFQNKKGNSVSIKEGISSNSKRTYGLTWPTKPRGGEEERKAAFILLPKKANANIRGCRSVGRSVGIRVVSRQFPAFLWGKETIYSVVLVPRTALKMFRYQTQKGTAAQYFSLPFPKPQFKDGYKVVYWGCAICTLTATWRSPRLLSVSRRCLALAPAATPVSEFDFPWRSVLYFCYPIKKLPTIPRVLQSSMSKTFNLVSKFLEHKK